MSAPFSVKSLESVHDRTLFKSGSYPLDTYFQCQVAQDIRRRVTTCFVALTEEKKVVGYYTLSSASLLLTDLPVALRKKLPHYPAVPTVKMGRLAVDQNFKGQGLGGALLADAIERAIKSEIAIYAFVVDAKDEFALRFYLHHGFILLPDSQRTLFLPLSTIEKIKRFK